MHSGDVLGEIYWRSGWRRYVMHFETDCDWSIECMAQCYKFIQKLMQDRKLSEVKVADGTPTTNDGIPPNNKLSGILPTIL